MGGAAECARGAGTPALEPEGHLVSVQEMQIHMPLYQRELVNMQGVQVHLPLILRGWL